MTVNIWPVVQSPRAVDDLAATPEDTAVQLNVLANDFNPRGSAPLTITGFSAGPQNGELHFNASDQTVTYRPRRGFSGEDQFNYTLTNNGVFWTSATVRVTVLPRGLPSAVDDNFALDRDTALTLTVLANDHAFRVTDTVRLVDFDLPQNGALELQPNGALVYRPFALYTGLDYFMYTLEDRAGLQASAQVTLTVRPVDTPPSGGPVVRFTQPGVPVIIEVGPEAYNPSGKPIIIESYGQPPHGRVSWIAGTQFWYTPTLGYEGEATFTYTLRLMTPCEQPTQPTLRLSCPALLAAEQLAAAQAQARPGKGTVIVGNVANPEVSASDGTAALAEGARATLNPLGQSNSARGQNVALIGLQRRQGLLNLNDDGTVDYTPPPGFSGVDVLTYTVSDGNGGVAVAYITVTVDPATRPPFARADITTVVGNTSAIIPVLANDTNAAGGALTVTAITAPEHGVAALNPDSTVTYTPTAYFNGSDVFMYTVVNAQGLRSRARVWLTVTRVNSAPTAEDDLAFVIVNTTTDIRALANDTDLNGDALRITHASAVTGTVRISPLDSLLYTPPAGFTGTTTLSYTVSDGEGGWATALVSVTVSYSGPRALAASDTFTSTLGLPLALDVLANDQSELGLPLTIISVSQPQFGQVTIDPDTGQSLLFTPGVIGAETFTYTVSNGYSQFTAQVTVDTAPTLSGWLLYLPLILR